MLERMKERVEEDESLSQAYGEIAGESKSVDDEINAAIGSSSGGTDERLAALNRRGQHAPDPVANVHCYAPRAPQLDILHCVVLFPRQRWW